MTIKGGGHRLLFNEVLSDVEVELMFTDFFSTLDRVMKNTITYGGKNALGQ
jgi:hypothetical protein